jgi:hypothetical protein
LCEYCIQISHKSHLFAHVLIDLATKQTILKSSISDIQDQFCDTTFKLIEEFKKNFEQDYENEENRIKNQYRDIKKQINDLEELELTNLKKSRDAFLENKFRKIFEDSDKVSNSYTSFYISKDQCKK